VVLANGVWFANPGPEGDPEIDAWTRDEIDATTAHDIVLADLDDDGDLDVVKRHPGAAGDAIRVFRQDSGSTWTERTIPATAGEASPSAISTRMAIRHRDRRRVVRERPAGHRAHAGGSRRR